MWGTPLITRYHHHANQPKLSLAADESDAQAQHPLPLSGNSAVRCIMQTSVETFVRLALKGTATEQAIRERKALWDSLSSDQRKQATESRVFIKFAQATGLFSDPFEHSNEDPPRPDIRASIGGLDYYFELGEITDESLARNISVSLRHGTASVARFPRSNRSRKCCRRSVRILTRQTVLPWTCRVPHVRLLLANVG